MFYRDRDLHNYCIIYFTIFQPRFSRERRIFYVKNRNRPRKLGGHHKQTAPGQAVAGAFPPFFGEYVQAKLFGRGSYISAEPLCHKGGNS